jgi:membrane protein DedA with SNARE-associated domain
MHFYSSSTVTHLLGTYGYWAVLVFVFSESTGVPLPGETILIAAAIYAGATHHLTIWWVVLAGIAGAILGDNTGYAIGRAGGFPLLRRFGRYIRLDEGKLKLGQYIFIRYGAPVVFFGRFVSILRTYAAFLAGVNRMPWPRFLVFNAAGGALWACLYGFGAYFLGKKVNQIAGPVGIILGMGAVIVIVAFLIFVRRNMSRLQAEAERADQGRQGIDEQTRRIDGGGQSGDPHMPWGDGHPSQGEKRPGAQAPSDDEREDARSGQ